MIKLQEKDSRQRIYQHREATQKKAILQKQMQEVQNQQGTPEHYVDSTNVKNNQISEWEIEKQVDILFSETPIHFKPRRKNDLDENIAVCIYNQHITIPIMHIKENLYLVGPNRYNCDLKAGQAMIKAGGGYQRFDEYVPRFHRQFQKKLVSYMVTHNQSLEWVCNELVQSKNL